MKEEEINPWKTLSKEEVYNNNWISVEHHQVVTPGGRPGIYGRVHFKNLAIGIVPLDHENNTWLVGQYRYPLKKWSWEIPEGGGPLNVAPLLSAQRELQEECGLRASDWELLLELDLSNSVTDERALIFLARGLNTVANAPDHTEQLKLMKVPLHRAFEMIRKKEITDAISVAALMYMQLNKNPYL